MSDQMATPGQDWVPALLRERAGLARRGLVDRVAQVDAELARLGYVCQSLPPAAAPMALSEPPRARRARRPAGEA